MEWHEEENYMFKLDQFHEKIRTWMTKNGTVVKGYGRIQYRSRRHPAQALPAERATVHRGGEPIIDFPGRLTPFMGNPGTRGFESDGKLK